MIIATSKEHLQQIRNGLCKNKPGEEMGYITGVLDFYNELVKANTKPKKEVVCQK